MMIKSRICNHRFWIDFVYPNRCAVCNKVIVWNEIVCSECMQELPFLENPFLVSCKSNSGNLKQICSVFEYKGNAIYGVYNLKDRKGLRFGEFGGEYCSKYIKDSGIADMIDVVTFVPMSKKKKKKRGYNQAEKIARVIAKSIDKPLMKNLLIHKSTSTEQHLLAADERLINAKLSFDICNDHTDITGKTILLCDDVITTGATMNKCAELLLKMGAKAVFGATICSTEMD